MFNYYMLNSNLFNYKVLNYKTAMVIIGLSMGVVVLNAVLYRKYKHNKTVKYTMLVIIAVASVLSITMGFVAVDLNKIANEEAREARVASVIKENESYTKIQAEYGNEVVVKHTDNITPVNEADLKRKEVDLGEHKFTIKYKADEDEVEIEYLLTIVDTKAPVIKGAKDIEIEEGETLDFSKLGITAEDKVDGKIDVKFEGKVENKPGDYKIKAIAKDSSDNEATQTFTVKVKAKPEAQVTASKPTSGSPNTQAPAGGGSKPRPNSGGSAKPQPKPEPKPEPKPQPKPQPKPVDKIEYLDGWARDMHNAVNAERKKAGVAPMAWDESAHQAARIRAKELITLYSHTRPDGSELRDMISGEWLAMGENIVSHRQSVADAMSAFMNSPGHKNTMLRDYYNSAGYGVVRYKGNEYYVQIFVGR